MKHLTWMARHPELYRREREQVENRYPGLKFCETAFRESTLMYHGEIEVRTHSGTSKKKILLTYPLLFPTNPPNVALLESLPVSEPHGVLKRVIISARHQMNDGNLCSVERDPFHEGGGVIRGIDVLRRAAQWFFTVQSGHNPRDSVEADLESHLLKIGDILLGPESYSDELKMGGNFYMAPYPIGSFTTNKFIGLAFSSDFEHIVKFKDCRKTLESVFTWIGNDVWNTAENLASKPEDFRKLQESGQIIKGFWWDLEKEPLPPRKGFDLLKLICDPGDKDSLERVFSFFSTDLTIEEFIYVGLRYPDRKEGFDWLICRLRLRKAREKTPLVISSEQKLELIASGQITALYRHALRKKELMLRNQGRVPANIAEKSISLFGVGSVGSTIAELLAKSGVGNLKLFDYDVLKTGNVIRHQSGIEFFGEPKVLTTSWKLVQHNPFAEISPYSWNLSDSYQTIDSALSQSDLVISSTANEPLETAVNEVAILKKQTVYYVRAMRGGAVGRIFRVIPGQDACRYCISRYQLDSSSDEGKWLDVPDDEDTLLSFECGNPVLAASGVDLTIISALCTKIVLEDIESSFGQNNHWLWASEALENHPALVQAHALSSRQFTPLPNCPFCSKPPVKSLVIPPDVKTKIEELVIDAGVNETGGILIGYFDEEKNAVVTNASDPGPNAVCTPVKFLKDIPYTQKWLEDQIRSSLDQVEYIGEWHSHPNSDTTPSITDIGSLNGIADSPDYLCRTPVMLIAGSNGNGEIVEISTYSFAQDRPFQEIEFIIQG
jgi:integrative and conjugative element protein (TIGR02256 family)